MMTNRIHSVGSALALQLTGISPTAMASETDCSGNVLVRTLGFPITLKNYLPFLIIILARLLAQAFLVLVVYRRGYWGTSLSTAEPLPRVSIPFMVLVYIAGFMNAFHQFELQARFVCMGSKVNPCQVSF